MTTSRVNGFQRLAVVTTGLSLVLVAVGGAVRATDSGLACPDWPRCFGQWIPPADLHMWLEHSHRLVAGVVGIAIGVLAVWALLRYRHRPAVLWPALAALVLVVVQAALGAVVVLRLLQAELVTAHLGMAMVVVGCLVGLSVAAGDGERAAAPPPGVRVRAWAGAAVAALCFAQILVGGHVTGIGAGLVYTDFPLMGGAVLPAVATEQEAFHAAHRLLAYALAGGAGALLYVTARARRAVAVPDGGWLARLPAVVLALVVGQVGLGVANLMTATSALTVIPHLAVASWIWTLLVLHTLLAFRALRARAAPDTEPHPASRAEVPA